MTTSVQNNNTLLRMQNNTNKVRYEQGQQNLGSGKIDKQAFLQLLLTQLQHQDPMNPMEDTEFISQQAQFTQIEKMDEMIAAQKSGTLIAQASNLVGKEVEYVLDSGETRVGRVDSVKIGSEGAGLVIDDQIYSMGQVSEIFAESPTPTQ